MSQKILVIGHAIGSSTMLQSQLIKKLGDGTSVVQASADEPFKPSSLPDYPFNLEPHPDKWLLPEPKSGHKKLGGNVGPMNAKTVNNEQLIRTTQHSLIG